MINSSDHVLFTMFSLVFTCLCCCDTLLVLRLLKVDEIMSLVVLM